MSKYLRDLFHLIKVRVDDDYLEVSAMTISPRDKFRYVAKQTIAQTLQDSRLPALKDTLVSEMMYKYDHQQHPKPATSNIDMMHNTSHCESSPNVKEMIRPNRLYQELDNLVYDFGSFHVFYTLKCLFEDLDSDIKIDHSPTQA